MAKAKTTKRAKADRKAGREPNILAGALAGLAAGLVASFAMEQAQALAGKLGLDPSADSDADPSTVKAAQAVAVRARGFEIEDERAKKTAGSAVHTSPARCWAWPTASPPSTGTRARRVSAAPSASAPQ